MGEAKRKCEAGQKAKGPGYKKEQVQAKLAKKRRQYIKLAHVTDKWMIEHGYGKTEDGKWQRR